MDWSPLHMYLVCSVLRLGESIPLCSRYAAITCSGGWGGLEDVLELEALVASG